MQIGSGSKAPSSRLASGRLERCYALNKIQQCGKRLVNIRVGCIIILKACFLKPGIADEDKASAEEKKAASIVGEHCEKAGTPYRRRVL
jgi:hypothetical protein